MCISSLLASSKKRASRSGGSLFLFNEFYHPFRVDHECRKACLAKGTRFAFFSIKIESLPLILSRVFLSLTGLANNETMFDFQPKRASGSTADIMLFGLKVVRLHRFALQSGALQQQPLRFTHDLYVGLSYLFIGMGQASAWLIALEKLLEFLPPIHSTIAPSRISKNTRKP